MQDTTPFRQKETRASLQLVGTPALVRVTDEVTGEKSLKEREAFVPAWKQTVTDEQGRRRFHGAFTGGFSAGYFNSVGSKEGWKPASFASSRDARTAPQQSVSDFMDEEDVAAGIGGPAGARGKPEGSKPQSAPGTLKQAMAQMLERVPDEKNVGLVLMRKMGWQDGQGIGPLVRRSGSGGAGRKKGGFGPALSREEIEEIRSAPIAPRDIPEQHYEVKDNTNGLGFDPYANAPEFALANASKGSKGGVRRHQPSRVAFGLGVAKEEEGFDPFAEDDMAQYDRVTGDVESKERGPAAVKRERAQPLRDGRRCSDGRAPIPGFELGPVLVDAVHHSPIAVPVGWKPSPLVCENLIGDASASPALTQWALAQARRAVAEMAAQQVNKDAAAAAEAAVARQPSPPRANAVAPAVGNALNPFPHDPEKQKRYQSWLVAQTGFEGIWANKERPSEAEIAEFEATKAKFSAVPAGMTDRFAPAGHVVAVKNEDELRAEEFRKYGRGTTRTDEDWAPSSLLCRRWGVKDPFGDGRRPKPEGKVAGGGAGDIFPSLTRELEKQFGASYHAQMEIAEAEAAQRAEEAATRAQLQNPLEEVKPEVRPSQSVFSAIFERPFELTAMPEAVEHHPAKEIVSAGTQRDVVDVDAFVASKREPVKRERGAEQQERVEVGAGDSVLASIFGPAVTKKSKTLEMLDKTSVVKDFVSGAIGNDEKSKKKKKKDKKKKDKKKKDKKKKDKKKEKK